MVSVSKTPLTDRLERRRRNRERETPEFAAMVRRMIAAHGRRVAEADPEDLAGLVELHEALTEAIALAVRGQRRHGFSWGQIARGLGTTRQAAQQRFGLRLPRPDFRFDGTRPEDVPDHRSSLGA